MNKRYTIPDILRGAALIEMIVYHALWDIVFIYGKEISWYDDTPGYIWQQSICWLFILLSGFCTDFGHRKLKRGITVLICSAVITGVTLVVLPDDPVIFGVLTLIGSCMLAMIPLEKLFSKIHPAVGGCTSFIIFLIAKNIPSGSLGFEGAVITELPLSLYRNTFTAFLGFPTADFVSSDYFPVLPWIFLYFTGFFICRIMKRYNLMHHLSAVSLKPLEFIGKNSLWIYMLHQPVIYGLLWVYFSCF